MSWKYCYFGNKFIIFSSKFLDRNSSFCFKFLFKLNFIRIAFLMKLSFLSTVNKQTIRKLIGFVVIFLSRCV